MVRPVSGTDQLNLPYELDKRKRIILGELKERTLWFIRLRWLVPFGIVAGTVLARWVGVGVRPSPLLWAAGFILAYNFVFFLLSRRVKAEPSEKEYIERFTYWQVGFDYGTMFLLIHFTGGIASPFIFFFIFHITFSAIFLPRRSTYSFAAIAAIGMGVIALAEYLGWIHHHAISFQGRAIDLSQEPFHMMVILSFFAGFVFITGLSITAVMRMLEKRIVDLAELTETVTALNEELNTLHTMTQAIVSKQHLEQVLHIATAELAKAMDVQAISVKLLSQDGKFLRYAASHGLPPDFMDRVIELEKSPLNRRVIEGEPFVTGRVTRREWFQFGEDLSAARLQSVQFVPLIVEGRVIGILGAYSTRPEQFGPHELVFFRQAAGLVAIAIENAQAYEAIENLIQERSRFMNRVAHNLRAPLAAMTSMLEVIREGYLGDLNETARKYLTRVDRRVQGMLLMIDELMSLAKSQSKQPEMECGPLNLETIASRIQKNFQEEVAKKRLTLEVTVPEDLPEIRGDSDMIEQMFENLISNAIKYTPEGGRVGMTFWRGPDEKTVRTVVTDNGIGIPKSEMPRLFTEFFRASNVQDAIGTGLGLAIVKEIVDKHSGQIEVESEEGLGTTFIINLPVAQRRMA